MRSVPPRGPPPSPVSRFCDTACRQPPHPTDGTEHSSDTCENQGQVGADARRPLAGEEARRRKRRGTHPPPRLRCFGRSHPNPTLTTAFLLHNAVRAGPIFEGSIAGDISWHQLPRCEPVWRARVPAACACVPASLYPVERWGARAAGSCDGRPVCVR